LAGNRIELVRETVPNLRQLAVLANMGNPGAAAEVSEVTAAASTLGVEAAAFDMRRHEDLAPAFDALKRRADALYVSADPLINSNRIRINTMAVSAHLPTLFGLREYV